MEPCCADFETASENMDTSRSSGGAATARDSNGDDRPFTSLSRAPDDPRASSVLTNAFEMLDSMNHLPSHISNLPNDQLDTGQMISVPQQPVDESGYSLALSPAGSESCDVSGDRGLRRPSQAALQAAERGGPSIAYDVLAHEGSSSNTQPLLMPQSLEEVRRSCGPVLCPAPAHS